MITTAEGYYHFITCRRGQGTFSLVIGADAQTIDEAARERAEIGKQWHRCQVLALSTHRRGTPCSSIGAKEPAR